ncbi:lectin subunit alpha [Stomoxys calcitrans]|uniref:C-type lectin domain-containing protein n=1 Tax=Stomoxys calcitrans TaxID=35570 RepID=A0A1I8NVB4_STOCA|nr:lectin subunit alpha [Stomoxys calcitrans]
MLNQVILCASVALLVLSQAHAGEFHTTEDGSQVYIETYHQFTWYAAQRECALRNMTLFTLDSLKKAKKLYRIHETDLQYSFAVLWSSGHGKRDGTYAWMTTGQKFEFNRWQTGKPSEKGETQCVHVYGIEHMWRNEDCNKQRGFACEKTPVIWEQMKEINQLNSSIANQTKEIESFSNITQLLQNKNKEIEALTKLYESNRKKLTDFTCNEVSYEVKADRVRNTEELIHSLQNSNRDQMRLLKAMEVEIDKLKKDQDVELQRKEIVAAKTFVQQALGKQN